MMSGTFSKKLGLGIFKGAPIFDDAPRKLRVGIWNLIEDLVEHNISFTTLPYYDGLYNKITAALHLERTEIPSSKTRIKDLVVSALEWNELFDLIQFLFTEVYYCEPDDFGPDWREISTKFSDARYTFTVKINDIFKSNNIGWKLKNGIFERAGNEVLDSKVITKAKLLLNNQAFAGPNSEFNKALEFFSKRPKPDLENCVKEAVGALEGLVRILLKDKNITLGKATNEMVIKGIIRKPFHTTFHVLFGFVSNEPGSRHGACDLSKIDLPETEFVLYNSAVCMVFLANRFGVMPKEDKTIKTSVSSPKDIREEFPEPDEPSEFPEEPAKEEPPDIPDDDEVPF